MEDLAGKKFGLYQIVTPLGEGGMAAVYKAYQFSVDRYVALKVLPRQFADDSQFIKRFDQEAKVLASLQHPHILPVHDYGHADNYAYIVMPLVAGGDLADLLHTRHCSLEEIGQIISQVGDALDYAHTQGIVHRDVKPSNILIDKRGNCLLSDFGLAKMIEGTSNLTGSGYLVGTPDYMSPEQGMGQTLDGRSDIYSLGVVLYEMVTGQTPFRAETPIAVVFKHIQDPLPLPSKIDPTVPEAVEGVILKSMAKQPEDRYATPGEMVKALQVAIQSATSMPQAESVISPKQYPRLGDKTRQASGPISNMQTTAPTPTKEISNPSGLGQMMLWGGVSMLLIIVIGLTLLGLWRFSQPGGAVGTPPPPAGQPTPIRVQLELPQPTQTPIPQPQPTPLPTSQPQPAQPPADQSQPGQPPSPPQAAVEACRGAAEGNACTVNLPRGPITGSCRPVLNQLACIPEGGPPPPPGP